MAKRYTEPPIHFILPPQPAADDKRLRNAFGFLLGFGEACAEYYRQRDERKGHTVTLAEFLTQQETAGRPIALTVARVESNPNAEMSEWNKHASHWLCSFTFQDRTLTTYFSQGSAHKDPPTAESVLECLLMGAQSVENCGSFEEWAGELGFDLDSRKAERSYNVVVEQTNKLRAFLTPLLYRQALRIECE